MANQHPFPDLVLDGGSFCLTTPDGPAGGWQVIEYRDQDAKADTVRFEVLRQLEQDGRQVEQVAARDMRSKALANALAGVLNGEMAVTDREQLRQLRDEADEPTPQGYGEARTATPLRVLRVAFGLSQADLAAAAGISRHTVIQLEKGTGLPKLRTARALAQVLRCEVLDLFPGLLPEGQQ